MRIISPCPKQCLARATIISCPYAAKAWLAPVSWMAIMWWYESRPPHTNGDIVIAMIEDEATVKRYYRENGGFRLQPENPTMEPIIVPEVTILGKVVSLYRLF